MINSNVFIQEITKLLERTKLQSSDKELSEIYATTSIVAFVDILGFKAMIQDDPLGERYIPIIERAIEEALLFARISIDSCENPAELGYRIFSDNICFWMPMRHHTLAVSMLLSVVAEFQLAMVFNGIFCRGGVSLGYHHASEHILYGPALVESVMLEHSNHNPCIVIANSIAEDIHLIRFPLQTHQFHKVSVGEPWFINYLSKAFFIEKEKSLIMLKKHRDVVQDRLEIKSSDAKIRAKYEWIANYHNDIVSMFKFKDQCPIIPSHLI